MLQRMCVLNPLPLQTKHASPFSTMLASRSVQQQPDLSPPIIYKLLPNSPENSNAESLASICVPPWRGGSVESAKGFRKEK